MIDTLKAAEEDGADLLNYVELCGTPVVGASGHFESTVRDVLTGTWHRVRSRAVINAAGPWADDVQARLGVGAAFRTETGHRRAPGRGAGSGCR